MARNTDAIGHIFFCMKLFTVNPGVWIKRGDAPYILMLWGCLQLTHVACEDTFHIPSITLCQTTGCTWKYSFIFQVLCLEYFGLDTSLDKSEKTGIPSYILQTFSKFCWNKLYILWCLYIVKTFWIHRQCVELLKIIHDTACDCLQLYRLYRQMGVTEIVVHGLERVQMLGDIWWRGHMAIGRHTDIEVIWI